MIRRERPERLAGKLRDAPCPHCGRGADQQGDALARAILNDPVASDLACRLLERIAAPKPGEGER